MTDEITHDRLLELRQEYLAKVQAAFGMAVDVVQSFRELSQRHPDDNELRDLTDKLCSILRQLLNTVTVKVAANGMLLDWDKLFRECRHDDSAGTSRTDSQRD